MTHQFRLVLDGTEIDCAAWRASGEPDKRLNSLTWSFITRAGDVRLVTPLQIPLCGAKGINPYIETVEIRSTLWPVAKLIADVTGAQEDRERVTHVEKFVRAVCGRWLVGFNHDGTIYNWEWMGKRFGADPDELCQLIDCGELLKPNVLTELVSWLAEQMPAGGRMAHAECLSVLEKLHGKLKPHILPESKKWRNDDSLDDICPFVVPTKKWGSQNCTGYTTWSDFCDNEAGEYGFVNYYVSGWLNNPINDRGLAVSGGYRAFLERHIDFEAIFRTAQEETRHLPVDSIAEKAYPMTAEDLKMHCGLVDERSPVKNETNVFHKPIKGPCRVCGWTHNDTFSLWQDGETEIGRFRAVRKKEPSDAVRILQCLHEALEKDNPHLTAQELSIRANFNGEPSAAFKHHRGAFSTLVKVENNYRSLKCHPSMISPQNLGEDSP